MSKYIKALAAIMLMTVVALTIGCQSENNDPEVKVITCTPQDITSTSAICGGDAIVTGTSLNELGVCWSTESNPTVEGEHRSTTNWNEPFICTITDLEPGTLYHVRAYALCGSEYYYGDDKNFTTKEDNGGGNGTNYGQDFVDLGLPSGTLWATCNLGALAPEEFGYYLAWGEIFPKTTYYWNNYKYCEASSGRLTKYCSDSDFGFNGYSDSLSVLLPEDDAVRVFGGSNWSIPTKEQWQELIDNITAIGTTQNGVKGCLFTASNGNSIFLPAAGNYTAYGFAGVGQICVYWSSSLDTGHPFSSFGFGFQSQSIIGQQSRCSGVSVRAVCAAMEN